MSKSSPIKLRVIIIAIATLFASCEKVADYPIRPSIEFESLALIDTAFDQFSPKMLYGFLRFSFIDGDGDLGGGYLDSITGEIADTSVIFIQMYYLENGTFIEAETQSENKYEMPYIEPKGNNPSINGTIDIIINDFNFVGTKLFPYDTIKYDFHIFDRAGHISNIESTPLIVIGDTINYYTF